MTKSLDLQQAENAKPNYKGNWAVFDKSNKQHMQLLSHCKTLMWTTEHQVHGEVADLKQLDKWLKSNLCPVQKPLKKMEPKEVSQVIKALHQMIKKLYANG